VLHRPDRLPAGATRQLLDGQALADRLGLTVVCDFRSADVAAGGQGAPLAPVYHAAALARVGIAPPAAFLNLGGVGNLTWWGDDGALIAFDTGPANGPINEWIEAHGHGMFDAGGAIAAAGRVDEGRLLEILDNPWFDQPPPKSLDRYDFPASLVRGMSLEDGAATLTALCAATVALGLRLLPGRPSQVVVGGGGARNPVLMAELGARCDVPLVPASTVGLNGDATEAECFAYLACRTLAGLPLSYPGTTGVAAPQTGGSVFTPRPPAVRTV
jgi:anhydro-N-acetylmuramic acid kinase